MAYSRAIVSKFLKKSLRKVASQIALLKLQLETNELY